MINPPIGCVSGPLPPGQAGADISEVMGEDILSGMLHGQTIPSNPSMGVGIDLNQLAISDDREHQ